ncbi:MAG: DUF2279 domain-containing protein [Deltaproteobacteria bacterium]|nr:DUF2279 domain-containing protein [Deltaproteobacteria bacterium]
MVSLYENISAPKMPLLFFTKTLLIVSAVTVLAAAQVEALESEAASVESARKPGEVTQMQGPSLPELVVTSVNPPAADNAPNGEILPRVSFGEAAKTLWLESVGMVGMMTFTGFSKWKWGSASFRFNSEGWFGMTTGSGGMDKLGHFFAGYAIADLLYWRLGHYKGKTANVSLYPVAYSMALMLYVEFFDGFSVDHGWSWEDVIMDAAGAGLSILRYAFPRVEQLVDFRFAYAPSKGQKGFHPIIDYAGQKYLLVFKLAGIPPLQKTPLRLMELMLGYYTRGFLKQDISHAERNASLFFGIGLNLEQFLFRPLEKKVSPYFNVLTTVSQHFQMPYVYQPITIQERITPRRN